MTAINWPLVLASLHSWLIYLAGYVAARLRERSTAVAIAGALSAVLGVTVSPDFLALTGAALAVIAGTPDGPVVTPPAPPAPPHSV